MCEGYGIPLHVRWGARKLESFVPEKSKYDTVVVTIWGDHLYLINEPGAKRAIVDEAPAKFDIADWCLAPIQRGERRTPGLDQWELFTGLMPGHFYSRDPQAVRTQLHSEYVCPLVHKNGMAKLVKLSYNNCTIHHLPQEAEVCSRFLHELAKSRPHAITYRGETFASFSQLVFDSLCSVDARPGGPGYRSVRASVR